MANSKRRKKHVGQSAMLPAEDLRNLSRFAILLVKYIISLIGIDSRVVSSHCVIYWRQWIIRLFKLHWTVWRIFFEWAKPTEETLHNQDLSTNTLSLLKRRMEWKRFMNANRMQIRKFTRRHIISSKRTVRCNSFNWFSYFGDEEDVIDSTLAPEQQAGQFAFGSTIDPSAQQQFNFGEDVNMS